MDFGRGGGGDGRAGDEALGGVSHDSQHAPALGLNEPRWAPQPEPVSEATRQKLDAAIAALLAHNLQRAARILEAHRDLLERCAQALLQHETLDTEALRTLTADLQKEAPIT